jgi:hypothetical protein
MGARRSCGQSHLDAGGHLMVQATWLVVGYNTRQGESSSQRMDNFWDTSLIRLAKMLWRVDYIPQ